MGRYLLFCVPLLCALAGAGLLALRLPIALVVLVALAAIGLPTQQSIRREHSPWDYRAAAEVIRRNAAPGDGIIYAPRDGWQLVDVGLKYYLRDHAPRDVLLASGETANASLWATECACPVDTRRVWVVVADNIAPEVTDQLSYAETAALRPYAKLVMWRVEGFTITLYVRPPTV